MPVCMLSYKFFIRFNIKNSANLKKIYKNFVEKNVIRIFAKRSNTYQFLNHNTNNTYFYFYY